MGIEFVDLFMFLTLILTFFGHRNLSGVLGLLEFDGVNELIL